MCNDYRLIVDAASIFEGFADLKIKIHFSEGTPNIRARDDIKITDTAPIVRSVDDERNSGDLVQRRWSWPGQNRKPVYNFRSDGREFTSGRCLIIADGFYEFTDPENKTKMTMEPGPDIAPYHDRQIVILERDAWADWLDPSVPAGSLIKPLAPNSLVVEQKCLSLNLAFDLKVHVGEVAQSGYLSRATRL